MLNFEPRFCFIAQADLNLVILKQLREERISLSLQDAGKQRQELEAVHHQESKDRNLRQELKQRPWGNTVY